MSWEQEQEQETTAEPMVAVTTDGCLLATDLKSGEQIQWAMVTGEELMDAPLLPHSFVAMHVAADGESVSLAAADGVVVVHELQDNVTEAVGDIEAGIAAMAWSPDDDAVVIVTAAAPVPSVLLLNRDWFPVAELPWDAPPPARPADPALTLDNQPPDGPESEIEFGAAAGVRITWRPDGAFFAVNAWDAAAGKRRINVYSRSGELVHGSDPFAALGVAMAWKPSGAVFATSQRLPEGNAVVFFESNALRHGQFTLAPADAELSVADLKWAPDGEVLAVLLTTADGAPAKLQLWAASNYCWALKDEIRLAPGSDPLLHFEWDPLGIELTLFLVHASGACYSRRYCWDTALGSGLFADNTFPVAVAAGHMVKITFLGLAVVPPPYATLELAVPPEFGPALGSPAFAPGSLALAVTGPAHVLIYEADGRGSYAGSPAAAVPLPEPLSQLQWLSQDALVGVGADGASLVVLARDAGAAFDSLSLAARVAVEGLVLRLDVSAHTGMALIQLADGRLFRYQGVGGLAVPLQVAGGRVSLPAPCEEMTSMKWNGPQGATTVVIARSALNKLYINGVCVADTASSFALHARFLLYTTIAAELVFVPWTTDVSSSVLESQVTVLESRLVERGAQLVGVVETGVRVVLQMPRGNVEVIEPRPLVKARVAALLARKNYGAAFTIMRRQRLDLNLLVETDLEAFVTDAPLVVDQLGKPDSLNLVLTRLAVSTVSLKDATADANLRIVPQISSATDAGTALRAALAKTEKTRDVAALRADDGTAAGHARVNRVCAALRTAMLARPDAAAWELAILTSLAVQVPPALEEALVRVQDLRAAMQADAVGSPSDGSLVRVVVDVGAGAAPAPHAKPTSLGPAQALDYLVFLADADELFDVALGLYDWDLVRLVASRTQKDPREYAPLLECLATLPPPFAHHVVDTYLGRIDKALAALVQVGDGEVSRAAVRQLATYFAAGEFLDLANGESTHVSLAELHDLYLRVVAEAKAHAVGQAIAAEANVPILAARVAVAHAHALVARGKVAEGGALLAAAGEHAAAREAYLAAGEWRLAFASAHALGYDVDALLEMAYEASEKLAARGKAAAAAQILVRYARDVDAAVEALLAGDEWMDAVWTARQAGRDDLVEADVRDGVVASAAEWLSTIEEKHAKWRRGVGKLAGMFERRAAAGGYHRPSHAGNESEASAADDAFSDTSSVVSGFTTSTASSSGASALSSSASVRSQARRRRKAAAKRAKAAAKRSGGLSGEAYAVAGLKRSVPSAAFTSKVGELVRACLYFGENAAGAALQARFDAYLIDIEYMYGLLDMGAAAIAPAPAAPAPTASASHLPPGFELNTVTLADGSLASFTMRPVLQHEDVSWKARSLAAP
ncbi:elongator complex protein 1 [Thecamonas trahens ATCC 50062]|uniref:Elongator complex protein 1 n=1 Tax=Thecamonas trahens ATCC 50062 TaxID=461836 RepID=A0A0L0DIC7_THETB|nr:elongator complex protein 1 [Thecamonas trahens ATCC 50062]KNC51995.1 elongator complex protein 1 [Thecamonas trahens ATCC 50062]|eukprot:XP_013755579.1 elongator complex protein 1 [Thecamonas trahens ATCC 50062]